MAKVPMTVGIIVYPDVEELDVVGPWEVFQVAGEMNNSFRCRMISYDGRPVRAKKGMTFNAHGAMTDDNLSFDMVLLPGGLGARALMEDQPFIRRFKRLLDRSLWQTSVCTGSLVYAAAGRLKGKRAITHHGACDLLQRLEPECDVRRGERYVVDGSLVTAAGVSAGIDMSLWLVGAIESPEFAREVQQFMEYYPEPPFGEGDSEV